METREVFINYWIGQEPNPPSPTLNQMPLFVDIAPLAFVSITDDYQPSFDFLTQHLAASLIQGCSTLVPLVRGCGDTADRLGREIRHGYPGGTATPTALVARSSERCAHIRQRSDS